MIAPIWGPWWRAVLVGVANPPEPALKAYRKTQIGRGKDLKAKDFDAAQRAAKLLNSPADCLQLIVWMAKNGMDPLFVRPEGHEWSVKERAIVESIRTKGLNPQVLIYDEEAMYAAPAPATSPRDLIRLGWRDE
jgi:hypothetical protein